MSSDRNACIVCGKILADDEYKNNRCSFCKTQIAPEARERYEKSIRLNKDIKEFIARKRYDDAQKIYHSADFHMICENDVLFSFYGYFLGHATAPADADKASSFINYLKQNTDSKLDKSDRSKIEDFLKTFESKNKDVVLAIANFLQGGRPSAKIDKGDPYILFCIVNAGHLNTKNLAALLQSERLSAVNKVEIIRQVGKACRESEEKSSAEDFLYLCKLALSDSNLNGESKKEVAAALDTLYGIKNRTQKSKAARLIKKGGLKRKGAEGGASVVLEQERKKALKIAAVVLVCIILAGIAGVLVYGSRPTGIEALPDTKTTYVYEEDLYLRYIVKRTFPWMGSGTVDGTKLTVNNYIPEAIGEQEIMVSYKGITAVLRITISPKTLAAPAAEIDNGVLMLSGGAGYTVTLGEVSTVISSGFDIRAWAAAQNLAPGAHTLRIRANGDGVRLIDSPYTELTIYKLSAPVIVQAGDKILYTPQTGESRCTVYSDQNLLCELTGNPYALNPDDFAAGDNTLTAQALGSGLYLDSDPAETIVKKAAAPDFSDEYSEANPYIDNYAIFNAAGLECWYRLKGGSSYQRMDALISDLNLLPAQAGQYEVVLRRPQNGNELGSGFSAPVIITRLVAPLFGIDNTAKSISVTTIYAPSEEVSVLFYYKKSGDTAYTVSNLPLQDLLDSFGRGVYDIRAVACVNHKLVLASSQEEYEAPDTGYVQAGKYTFQWISPIFSDSESTMVTLDNVQLPLAVSKVSNASGNYYRAVTSNNTFTEVRIYTVDSNRMLFIKDGKNS